jgi:ribokinase
MFFDLMTHEGIYSSLVTSHPTLETSLGFPKINPQGENSIIGIPRANSGVRVEDVEAAQDLIATSDVLVLQLEIPVDASLRATKIASESGTEVVFNPAPAHNLIDPFIGSSPWKCVIDWIIPNEGEAEMISGTKIRDLESALQSAQNLFDRGIRKGVIVTLGKEEAVAVTQDVEWRQPAYQATSVGPTGAGDAFCGAFAVPWPKAWKSKRL